jgi:glutamate-1-semialdehyde aminotransferase
MEAQVKQSNEKDVEILKLNDKIKQLTEQSNPMAAKIAELTAGNLTLIEYAEAYAYQIKNLERENDVLISGTKTIVNTIILKFQFKFIYLFVFKI